MAYNIIMVVCFYIYNSSCLLLKLTLIFILPFPFLHYCEVILRKKLDSEQGLRMKIFTSMFFIYIDLRFPVDLNLHLESVHVLWHTKVIQPLKEMFQLPDSTSSRQRMLIHSPAPSRIQICIIRRKRSEICSVFSVGDILE